MESLAEDPGLLRKDSKCRVLIADDDRDSAEFLSTLLDLSGYEVQATNHGCEVLDIAATFLPAVVCLDIGMPTIDGYEVARRIREQPWGQSMLLVAVTGWGRDDDKEQARAAGFDHHVTKPVDLAELRRVLNAAQHLKGPAPE